MLGLLYKYTEPHKLFRVSVNAVVVVGAPPHKNEGDDVHLYVPEKEAGGFAQPQHGQGLGNAVCASVPGWL